MKRAIGVTTFLLASVAAATAHADLLNWAPGIGYSAGFKPVIGLGTTQFGEWAIEVHQGQAGPGTLYYESGRATGTGLPVLGPATAFDWGFNTSIATFNTNENAPSVVEVHQGQQGEGSLWYSVGTMSNIWTPHAISWTSAQNYDAGYAPTVAALNGTVVEIHQAAIGRSELWYHVGTASGSGVSWGPSYAFDVGVAPSVAIANTPNGMMVIEVHQGNPGFGSLWYSTGTVNGNTISWSSPAIYDGGVAPQVAADQTRAIEVHQGTAGVGPLWYHMGAITGTGQSYATPTGGIAWDQNAHEYLSGGGYSPAVAFDPVSVQGYELHQQTSGYGEMIAQIFTTRPVVPLYPQLESNWCWITAAEMTMQSILGEVKNDLDNGTSGAEALECQAANLRQQKSNGWGQNGAYLDCCASESWNDSTGCDHTGDYASVLNDDGFSHNDTSTTSSFSTIANEIASGRPVPFGINWNPQGNGGHALVIAGTEVDESGGEWIVINDPGGVQWINPYSWFQNQNTNSGPWVVSEMSTNVKAP